MTQRFLAGAAEKGAVSLDNMVQGMRGAAGISVPFLKKSSTLSFVLNSLRRQYLHT